MPWPSGGCARQPPHPAVPSPGTQLCRSQAPSRAIPGAPGRGIPRTPGHGITGAPGCAIPQASPGTQPYRSQDTRPWHPWAPGCALPGAPSHGIPGAPSCGIPRHPAVASPGTQLCHRRGTWPWHHQTPSHSGLDVASLGTRPWHPRACGCAIPTHPAVPSLGHSAVPYPGHPAVASLGTQLCHPQGTRPQSRCSPHAIPVSGVHALDTRGATRARHHPTSLPAPARWAPDSSSGTVPASPCPPATAPCVFTGSTGPSTTWTSTST